MDDTLLKLGRKLKEIRKSKKMVLTQVAGKAGVSATLISKIENGRTIPSLSVLISIIHSLEEDLGEFFKQIAHYNPKKYFVLPENEQEVFTKEENSGCSYRMIHSSKILSTGFEMVILTIDSYNEKRTLQTTDAYEIKYVLDGECEYQIEETTIHLKKGDALYFDGRLPHRPLNKTDKPCTMIVIYFFIQTH